jgi:hypothetical protein
VKFFHVPYLLARAAHPQRRRGAGLLSAASAERSQDFAAIAATLKMEIAFIRVLSDPLWAPSVPPPPAGGDPGRSGRDDRLYAVAPP